MFIDDDVGPFGESSSFIINAERLHHFAVSIAQKRVVDFSKVNEGFLGKYRVGANAQYFSVLGLKLGVVVRTGRLKALNSGWTKVEHVKIDQNILTFEAAKLEFAAGSAVKLELGGFVANLDGARLAGRTKKEAKT